MTMPVLSLSRFSGPVLAQQPYNSCAAHALYSVVHAMTQQAGALRKVSIYQPYGDARIMAGTYDSDPGAGALGDLLILKAGQQKGLADASAWSNEAYRMYMMPTATVYENAAKFKIGNYRQLPTWVSSGTWIENIRRELSHGKPLIAVMKQFYDVPYHVVTLTGVDHGRQSYICKNSLGADWGDAGYGYLHYSQNTNFFGVYAIDQLGPFDFTYTPERIKIAQLYACFLRRCPELAGLDCQVGALKSGTTVAELAQALVESTEGQALYGSLTNEQYVTAMYSQLLNRAPDQVGFEYFVDLLNKGAGRGTIFASTMDFIATYTGTDAGTLQERAYVENKTNVAMYYAVAMQMDGNHLDLARAALVGITSDPNSAEVAKADLAIALNRFSN
jgi:hypothetical protein